MKLKLLSIGIFLFSLNILFAQDVSEEKHVIHIKKAKAPIKLDGKLDEAAWQISDIAKDFFLCKPYDTSFAKLQTETKITFDDNFIYIGAVVHQPKSTYTTYSLKRDFEGGTSDVFIVTFDTFKDKLTGFNFAVTPYNVQREGLIANGEDLSNYWDNKWYSQVSNFEDYWIVEMAIPFKTLRYKIKDADNSWRVNFGRLDMRTNENSSWSPVPRNFSVNNVAFAGLMIWDDAPPKPQANISIIPFMSGGVTKDFPRNESDLKALPTTSDFTKSVGMDAKIAVTPSLNLDLTINPDFSQVEVDKQVTNLSRFELFFPERRQFFLENDDLFGKFGFPDTRPFFSRRIGITHNPNTNLSQRVPILAGARLSGKLNDDWRIGVMNMQTRQVNFGNDKYLPAANYAVAVLQRKVFTRSTIGGIFVNKDIFSGNLSSLQMADYQKYNRIAGLEFNYNSKDSRFESETYFHQSFSPTKSKDAASLAHFMGYHHPNIDLNLGLQRIGENYQAEVGFVPRTGVYQLYRPFAIVFNPKSSYLSKYINSYGVGTEGSNVYNLKGKPLDSETALFAFINTPANGKAFVGHYWAFTHLFAEFDPTNANNNPNPDTYSQVVPLPIGDYHTRYYFVGFETGKKNKAYLNIEASTGNYYNGKATVVESSASYRLQPYGILSVDCNYTKIDLPRPYNSVNYWLIGPRAELTLSRSVFFSTFFQYNTQTNNTNINSRLQWRFKPVSDLFLVYTDNYFSEAIPKYGITPWTPKNRALILKITYWLNV